MHKKRREKNEKLQDTRDVLTTCHFCIRILCEMSIQYGVGNNVAHFIRMTLAYRLRREEKALITE